MYIVITSFFGRVQRMVDREARDKLADLILRFADGQITVSEFSDTAPWKSYDEYVTSILSNYKRYLGSRSGVEQLSGDKLMQPSERARLGKLLQTLKSDYEYSQIHTRQRVMDALILPAALVYLAIVGVVAHWVSIGLRPVFGWLGVHINHYTPVMPMLVFGFICLATARYFICLGRRFGSL